MRKIFLVLLACFAIAYVLPLGVRPLQLPDEARYAEIPREMLSTGDWIVPHLDGIRYFEKPVFGYWLNAASMALLGESPFAVRLPAALVTGGAALLIIAFVRRTGADLATGLSAAAIFLTSAEVHTLGTAAVLDGMLAGFLTGTIVLFYLATTEPHPWRRRLFLVCAGGFCGLAFLTKGFLALAVPAAALVPYLVYRKRWRDLILLPWLPAGAALAVALPWSLAIHWREDTFWDYFFWNEHIRRFLSPTAQHVEPMWYFVPVLLVGFLPWTALAPALAPAVRRLSRQSGAFAFLVCWFVGPLVFFSVCNGKLATYILPCFPPLAILAAMAFRQDAATWQQGWGRVSVRLVAGIAGAAVVVLTVSQALMPSGLRVWQAGEGWKVASVGAAVLFWALLWWCADRGRRPALRTLICAGALVPVLVAAQVAAPQRLWEKKAPGPWLAEHVADVRPGDRLFATHHVVHLACWTFKRADLGLADGEGELAHGLSYADAAGRCFDEEQFVHYLADPARREGVVLMTGNDLFRRIRDRVPRPLIEDRYGKFLFVRLGPGPG